MLRYVIFILSFLESNLFMFFMDSNLNFPFKFALGVHVSPFTQFLGFAVAAYCACIIWSYLVSVQFSSLVACIFGVLMY